jgi:hypothetical protein
MQRVVEKQVEKQDARKDSTKHKPLILRQVEGEAEGCARHWDNTAKKQAQASTQHSGQVVAVCSRLWKTTCMSPWRICWHRLCQCGE